MLSTRTAGAALVAALLAAHPVRATAAADAGAIGDTASVRALHPAAAAESSGSASGTATVPFGPPGATEYLWITRAAITGRDGLDTMIARAKDVGARGLLVQVVGRGDAYYRSDLLPRAQAIGDPTFDPLGEIVARAHAAGLEVHAWMNCMLVWSAAALPRDPAHVVLAHPEWVAQLRDGRKLSRLGAAERHRLRIEGVFLAPGHPAVRTWVARIAKEIVQRYPVDGVHLDYIRQPGVAVGYDETTRARFAMQTGIDPAKPGRMTAAEHARFDSTWAAFQREQVTAVVREVRDSLESTRPGLPLSAAVIADTVTAQKADAQDWRGWVLGGLLDRVYVMCYAAPVQTVLDQLAAFADRFGTDGRVVPGIAVYNTGAGAAATKIKAARALGFPTLALYSYDSLFERAGLWDALRSQLDLPPRAAEGGPVELHARPGH